MSQESQNPSIAHAANSVARSASLVVHVLTANPVARARRDRPPVLEQGVVVDDEVIVSGTPHVELDRPGSGGDGSGERLHRVLPGEPWSSPMGDHEHH
jgi:hypothetical protein